jgi:hypothetical protein
MAICITIWISLHFLHSFSYPSSDLYRASNTRTMTLVDRSLDEKEKQDVHEKGRKDKI